MEQTSKLRRKVLRGSLAAPVVMTVSSASAAAGSFGRCLANAPTTTTAPFFTTAADKMVRIQVDVYPLMQRDLFTQQIVSLGNYYHDPVLNVFVSVNAPYTQLRYGMYTKPLNVQLGTPSKRWALAWLDRTTASPYRAVTIQQPTGSTACTTSCYGSFTKA